MVGHPIMFGPQYAKIMHEVAQSGRRAVVFAVDYSLSPAFPFPKALNECVAAYKYLLHTLHVSPRRIVLAGDSAGGNLVITTSLVLRDQREPLPAALVLVSPWVSLDATTPSYRRNEGYDILSLSFLREKREAYLQGRPVTPLASPIMADLAGLPPALIFAGGRELFHDDITSTRTAACRAIAQGRRRFGASLTQAGRWAANRMGHRCATAFAAKYERQTAPGHVQLHVEPDMFHDYMLTDYAGAAGPRALRRWAAYMCAVVRAAS